MVYLWIQSRFKKDLLTKIIFMILINKGEKLPVKLHRKPWISFNISVFLIFELELEKNNYLKLINFDIFLDFGKIMPAAKTILSFHLHKINEKYDKTAYWDILQVCINEKELKFQICWSKAKEMFSCHAAVSLP